MPSLFLSHSSADKTFVEKLAKDLEGVGVNVWFDKWEIKVGDSLTGKIWEIPLRGRSRRAFKPTITLGWYCRLRRWLPNG